TTPAFPSPTSTTMAWCSALSLSQRRMVSASRRCL
ncbi:hypothetical protein CFC21_045692, partial [Triticum aestivum]